ncbi:hypothetical protein D3C75_1142960 [compost metagenome]
MHLGVLRMLRRQRIDISQSLALTQRQLPLVNHRIGWQTKLVGNVAVQPIITVGTDGRNKL